MSHPVLARCIRGRLAPLWKTPALPCTPAFSASSLHTHPLLRGSQAFTRTPKDFIPGEKDKGKISLKDYAREADVKLNVEALREANRFNQIKSQVIRSKKQQDKSTSGYYDDSLDEQDVELKAVLRKIDFEIYEKCTDSCRTYLKHSTSRKLRDKHDLIMIEGYKMIGEAIGRGLRPLAVYFSRKALLLNMMPQHMPLQEKLERLATYRKFRTDYDTLKRWSSVVKSQGVIGIFKKSQAMSAHTQATPSTPGLVPAQLLVVLDSIREPGNLGAVLRSVAAVGATRVVCTKGCCDPWENKALRAGAGAQFSLQVESGVPWSRMQNHVKDSPSVILADVCNADRSPLREEGHLHPEDVPDVDTRNLLRATKREQDMIRRVKEAKALEQSNDDEAEEEASPHSPSFISLVMDEAGNMVEEDSSYDDEVHLQQFEEVDLPASRYDEVDYFPYPTEDRMMLVIGGETGLSRSARKFASHNTGRQVSIPLHLGTDSLNTSVAAGVILYEIHRQTNKGKGKAIQEDKERA